ncbi:uncharacterized protein [Coffea arabica]|uniref:RNase H type-1 domain-containing protein n=1 Tax=Coffea arabica TaxID=13443 RepID=A0ABM4UQS8_COFAR
MALNNRNYALFNGKIRHPLSLVNLAAHSLSEFHEANTRPIMTPPQTARLRWSAPPSLHFKINFDAAISTAQTIFGIGVVVRDHEGSFMAGLAKKFVGSVSVEIAEAHVAREVVYLARNLMIPSFILEGDAASIIKLILHKENILSDLGLILEDIYLALLDQLCIDVKWIPIEANKVAHILANRAKNANPYKSLWNAPPNFVKQIVLDDLQQFQE